MEFLNLIFSAISPNVELDNMETLLSMSILLCRKGEFAFAFHSKEKVIWTVLLRLLIDAAKKSFIENLISWNFLKTPKLSEKKLNKAHIKSKAYPFAFETLRQCFERCSIENVTGETHTSYIFQTAGSSILE